MDQARLGEALYGLRHRHEDGTWAEMTEERIHHDAADHDPERGWARLRIFRCTECAESVAVERADDLSRRS